MTTCDRPPHALRRPQALIVASSGPSRRTLRTSLGRAGYVVQTAAEPFSALDRFLSFPADLVVLSLMGFTPRDRGFIRTIRRRAPETRILLLVPEGERRTARAALRAGAHAVLPEPCYPDELQALARTLAPREALGPGMLRDPGLASLALEVQHAINNPLQILSLLGADDGVAPAGVARIAPLVLRMKRVTDILGRYGHGISPAFAEIDLGRALARVLAHFQGRKLIDLRSAPSTSGASARCDPKLVEGALEAMVDFLVGHATSAGDAGEAKPVPFKAAVRRPRSAPVVGSQPPPTPRFLEIALRGRGIHVPEDEIRAAFGQILLSPESTLRVHHGLKLPYEVARLHGGRLVHRERGGTTILALLLPRDGPQAG
ncbi:MAG: response regulator [Planctomycetota bacterium]